MWARSPPAIARPARPSSRAAGTPVGTAGSSTPRGAGRRVRPLEPRRRGRAIRVVARPIPFASTLRGDSDKSPSTDPPWSPAAVFRLEPRRRDRVIRAPLFSLLVALPPASAEPQVAPTGTSRLIPRRRSALPPVVYVPSTHPRPLAALQRVFQKRRQRQPPPPQTRRGMPRRRTRPRTRCASKAPLATWPVRPLSGVPHSTPFHGRVCGHWPRWDTSHRVRIRFS